MAGLGDDEEGSEDHRGHGLNCTPKRQESDVARGVKWGWQEQGQDDDLRCGFVECGRAEGHPQETLLETEVRLVIQGRRDSGEPPSHCVLVTSPPCPF